MSLQFEDLDIMEVFKRLIHIKTVTVYEVVKFVYNIILQIYLKRTKFLIKHCFKVLKML